MRQPVGPCFFITPWNFPTAMGTRKIGPAIAAGCTMVWKPAKQTPLSAFALTQILEECGLPGGVLNVITSSSSSSVAEAGDRRSPAAKAVLHRLDRGRPRADRPGGGERPQRLDGAGRQRPVPDLRRRRPGRGAGGSDDRQDAEHRRGLHLGEPLPRRRVAGRRVRVAARGPHGLAEGRPGHRGGRRRRPADRRRPALEGGRAGRGRGGQGRHGCGRRGQARRRRLLLRAHRARRREPATPAC